MRNRIRAAIACLKGHAVVANTHTTGIHFTRTPRGMVIVNNTITPNGGYSPSRA